MSSEYCLHLLAYSPEVKYLQQASVLHLASGKQILIPDCLVLEFWQNVDKPFCGFLVKLKGNVAVYKVLNLEMLLYKVRWHVSTVKDNRPILTLRTCTHLRNVIPCVLEIDHG